MPTEVLLLVVAAAFGGNVIGLLVVFCYSFLQKRRHRAARVRPQSKAEYNRSSRRLADGSDKMAEEKATGGKWVWVADGDLVRSFRPSFDMDVERMSVATPASVKSATRSRV